MPITPTVIVYHGVGDVASELDPYHLVMPVARFEWQMAYLARHRQVIPLDAIVEGRIPPGRPAVAITFDDGFRSVLNVAAPILAGHDFPATLFVPTAWVGGVMGWEPWPAGTTPLELMTADEIQACERLGHEIGSHGHAHEPMSDLPGPEAEADLAASFAGLGAILEHPPRYVAYPWGKQSQMVRESAQRVGFEAGFSINQVARGPHGRERVSIRRSDPRPVFAAKTSGRYLRIRMSPVPRATLRLALPVLDRYRRR